MTPVTNVAKQHMVNSRVRAVTRLHTGCGDVSRSKHNPTIRSWIRGRYRFLGAGVCMGVGERFGEVFDEA